MHRVDQIGVEEFTDSADSAAESNVLALRCLTCLREGRRGVGVDEVECRVR